MTMGYLSNLQQEDVFRIKQQGVFEVRFLIGK